VVSGATRRRASPAALSSLLCGLVYIAQWIGTATLSADINVERPRRLPHIPARRDNPGATMNTFDDRQKSFEKKFERDQDLQFKVNARRNKLLGLWAAGVMGKSGTDTEGYA
jgi:ATPase inhibitor subunit zeta